MHPLELGFVRTSRDPDFPWVRFELTRGVKPGEENQPFPLDGQWARVHDGDVRRVEMRFEEKPPFDFDDSDVLEDDLD